MKLLVKAVVAAAAAFFITVLAQGLLPWAKKIIEPVINWLAEGGKEVISLFDQQGPLPLLVAGTVFCLVILIGLSKK